MTTTFRMADLLREAERRIMTEPPAETNSSTSSGEPAPLLDLNRPIQIEAGAFIDRVEEASWQNKLRETLDCFRMFFCDVAWDCPDDRLLSRFNITDRKQAMQVLLADLTLILEGLGESSVKLRKTTAEKEARWNGPVELADGSTSVKLDFPFNLRLELGAGAANRRPLRGVLFPIDSISEATPAVGPGCPLYVPESVAIEALAQVHGLPLDAADSLDKHAKNEIVGVMSGGSIEIGAGGRKDFVVDGLLWNWSQPQKVATIAANREILGMSMNANASGKIVNMEGRDVYVLDRLQLLGANILQSDKATFKTTNLIEAQDIDPELDLEKVDIDEVNLLEDGGDPEDSEEIDLDEEDSEEDDDSEEIDLDEEDSEEDDDSEDDSEDDESSVSASASTPATTFTEDQNMSQHALSRQFKTFTDAQMAFSEEVATVVGELQADLMERREQQELQAAAEQIMAVEQTKQSLVEEVAQAVIVALQAQGVLQASSQQHRGKPPARRTIPLAAAAANLDEEEAAASPNRVVELQLASVAGQIKLLEEMPSGVGDNSRLFELIDQRNALAAQLR